METIRKTGQFFEIIFLLLAIVLLWGAESLTEDGRANQPPQKSLLPDDLTSTGTGSFIGS